jgi:glutathione peroxidase
MKKLMTSALVILAMTAFGSAATAEEGAFVLGHTVKDIDGNTKNLLDYKGKVLLIVNVASKCGMTPQYSDLVALHEKYSDQGVAILGFPANNFAGQEPGTNAQIKEFCSTNYNVTFDMFSKVSVAGEDKAPLYQDLTSTEKNGDFGGEISWNFTKFLVGRDGKVIARFEPRIRPTSPEVVEAIESALVESQ